MTDDKRGSAQAATATAIDVLLVVGVARLTDLAKGTGGGLVAESSIERPRSTEIDLVVLRSRSGPQALHAWREP